MLLIPCPHCGPRDEVEFACGGEAGRVRPADPAALSDAEWADFLFMRANPKGPHRERWVHTHGCRRWFVVERSTVTHAITNVEPIAKRATEEAPAERPAERAGGRS